MRRTGWIGVMLAASLLLVVAPVCRTVRAVPFSSLVPRPALQRVGSDCVLDASSLNISSIAQSDLGSYASAGWCSGSASLSSSPHYSVAILLQNNSLSSLPSGLFAPPNSTLLSPGSFHAYTLSLSAVNLARNQFTGASIANFFNRSSNTLGSCVFCGMSPGDYPPVFDLSFNALGPEVPIVFQQATVNVLNLLGTGITTIAPNAFAGFQVKNLDLSLNNITTGLHAHSFDSITWFNNANLYLRNCLLRSDSLPAGVFEVSNTVSFSSATVDLSNFNADTFTTADANRFSLDPLATRKFFSTTFFNPPGQAYAFRPPTVQQFDDSWGNFFDPFPAGVFYTAPIESPYQVLPFTDIRIGDVASFHPSFLSNLSTLSLLLTIELAPHSVAAALSGVAAEDYCPMHSLMHAFSFSSTASGGFTGAWSWLTLSAYDLPSPLDSPSNCVIPDCSSSGSFGTSGCRNFFPSVTTPGDRVIAMLPTEPVVLQRAAVRWFASVGLIGTSTALHFQPPLFGLWNPALNRSDWTEVSLICDLDVYTLGMPSLPYTEGGDVTMPQLPCAPPSGMLACLSRSSTYLASLTWQTSLFTSGTFAGFSMARSIPLALNIEALYGGPRPVPVAFFDDSFDTLAISSTCTTPLTCGRIASKCPYIVNGVCQRCPLGYWSRGMSSNLYWYCSACTVGSYCNSTLTQQLRIDDLPLPCPQGSFQSDTTQSSCTLCPRGTYNGLTGRSDPSSCLQCPPGTANPSEGGTTKAAACQQCLAGSFNAGPGMAACTPCTLGSFSEALESNTCTLCPAGRFGTVLGANSSSLCESCPPSTPSSPAGSSSIQQCTGPVCSDGYYAALSMDIACSSQCPLGSSCAAGRITECAAGSYTDQPAQRSCTACGAGRVGSAGSTSALSCSACPISTYSSPAVSGACTPCPAGQVTAAAGSTSSAACQAIAGCETASTLTSNSSTAATLSYCPLAGRSPISLSSLLPGGLEQMRAYLQRADQINSQTSGGGSSVNATMSSAALEGVYATYSPLRSSESLRLAAFGSDATLDDFDALGIVAAKGRDPFAISTLSAPILSSATYFAIILAFLIIAFAPWLLYRYLPPRVVLLLDQFSLAHQVRAGKFVQQVPTQFGAITSWSFLWVAALVAILLATQSNTVSTIELLPPSAFSSQAGTAAANWQITLRAHTGETVSELSAWCNAAASSSLMSRQTGFSSAFTVRTSAATAGSCSVSADCLNCGLSASTALTSFTFPSSAQLIEWDLWVTSAQPSSWTRRYGVLTQLPGRLIDAQSSLHFSGMESYFNDERTPAFNKDARSGASARRSGFEISFLSFAVVEPQSAATFTASSTVTVTFSLQKSDVILHTRLSDKQTPLQLLTLIASAVVSLFSMFALAFRVLESRLIKGCGLSSGEVLPVEEDEQRKMQGVQMYAAGTSQTAATGGLVAAHARSPTATASSPARTVEMQRRQQQQQPLASPSAASQIAWGERK